MNTYVPQLTEHGQNKIQNEYETLKEKYMNITSELRRVGVESLDDAFATSIKKVEQLFLEEKMKKIQHVINRMSVIKKHRGKLSADVGSKVTYLHGDKERTVTLVEPIEADPSIGFIPVDSPLGRAILGRKANETIDVTAPKQTYHITLLKIE
jgi:transcription elongation factor GreA